MEGNKMNTDNTETTHQDGPSWKTVGRFPTFAEADSRRVKLSEEKDLQVKVHHQGPQNKLYFAVKTRSDPKVAEKPSVKKNKNRSKE
tara:strand:+ start:67 stop:327 length:261 start_codon:yes stop_codon:yes gene_type:complete